MNGVPVVKDGHRGGVPGTSGASANFALDQAADDPNSRQLESTDNEQSRVRMHFVLAGFLGWTLDAFDFFVVVFLIDTLAHQFGVPKKDIVFTMTATLAMRPIGAVLSGCWRTAMGAASR